MDLLTNTVALVLCKIVLGSASATEPSASSLVMLGGRLLQHGAGPRDALHVYGTNNDLRS